MAHEGLDDVLAQRRAHEQVRSTLARTYAHLCGGLWRHFYAFDGGVVLTAVYDNLQLRDAYAVRELATILPFRQMASLLTDEPEASFAADIVTVARPDLLKSSRAKQVLAEAHRQRRLFMLGRYAFLDIESGRCYWRRLRRNQMTEYGVIARSCLSTGHHVIMIAGLSWVGTWAAAKAATDRHYLGQIQRLLANAPTPEGSTDISNEPFEVLVEVTYDVDKEARDYKAPFEEEAIRKLITKGVLPTPTSAAGGSSSRTKVFRDEDILLRPIEVFINRERSPQDPHVVVALTADDCPVPIPTDARPGDEDPYYAVSKFVVDGVLLTEKKRPGAPDSKRPERSPRRTPQSDDPAVLDRERRRVEHRDKPAWFRLLMRLWSEPCVAPEALEAVAEPHHLGHLDTFQVADPRSVRSYAHEIARDCGVREDVVHSRRIPKSHGHVEYLLHCPRGPLAADTSWTHVGLTDDEGEPLSHYPPGLPRP